MKSPDLLSWYSEANGPRALVVAGILVAAIALADWLIETNISLGFLYFFPVVLAAGFLKRWHIVVLALACAVLRETFSPFSKGLESIPRTGLVFSAFLGAGLFVREMAQNRRLVVGHLREIEKQVERRTEAEEQLRVLIESSPAAILTLDAEGKVLLANEAAHQMLACDHQPLEGEPIGAYLPILSAALRSDGTAGFFRTALEARGRRRNGDIFLAHIWLSTYSTHSGPRLAAIILDASEELRDREESGLHQLLASSRILVGAVSHEIRNMCGAIAVVHTNLMHSAGISHSEDLKALGNLVEALRKIASAELRLPSDGAAAGIDLRPVLDDLRIVIEASFRESQTGIAWEIGDRLPPVRAGHQDLLQVFLNLAQNSHRAMQDAEQKLLRISASVEKDRVVVRFHDTGRGVAHPDRLFRPFQHGADIAGLGLYVSRAIVRGSAGDLRYEPQARGSCFAVELMRAGPPEALAS